MSKLKYPSIYHLQKGLIKSVHQFLPVCHQAGSADQPADHSDLELRVQVGLTGDFKGEIFYEGNKELFSVIGEKMYGMVLEGELLTSFAGELCNMISGTMCTTVSEAGLTIDITTPVILAGENAEIENKQLTKLKLIIGDSEKLLVQIGLDE